VSDSFYDNSEEKDPIKELDQYDYCLIKIESLPNRNDYKILPFYPIWEEIQELLIAGQINSADWKKIELLQQIAVSPDLTEEHRGRLIETFEIKYLELASKKIKRKATTRRKVRGVLDTVSSNGTQHLLDAKTSLQKAAAIANKAKYPNEVVKDIMNLHDNWERITKQNDLEDDFKLSDDAINEQISILKNIYYFTL